jgi:hypothetical protein
MIMLMRPGDRHASLAQGAGRCNAMVGSQLLAAACLILAVVSKEQATTLYAANRLPRQPVGAQPE